jgi:hypothetical protein
MGCGGWTLSIAVIVLLVIVDISAMVGVNVLYIQLYTDNFPHYDLTPAEKHFAQFALGAVKAMWNVLVNVVIKSMSDHGSTVLRDGQHCLQLGTALLL